MMMRTFLAMLAALSVLAGAVTAQQSGDEVVWVQVEAHPSLAEATDRARAYARRMEDVNGFSLGGGWYAVALGPYVREDAETVLRVYRNDGLIPSDSYIIFTSSLSSQFWPIGRDLLAELNAGTAPAPDTPAVRAETPAPAVATDPALPEETPREARASESRLSADERKRLQEMLQWAGHYRSAIDGAFGRGTRAAMAAWQEANGFEATGVLTTRQRAALAGQYNAVLEGMGLATVTDTTAGIEIAMPTGVVSFDTYEAPFAHYTASGALGATVLLISQPGDRSNLFALYDILQTLEIVPLDGPRERRNDSFTLVGENARIVSHTEARLVDGAIKGFTLVWPAGDEERRTRLLDEMRASFTPIDGVLDPVQGLDAAQDIDLVSGLEIRKPLKSRSGFYIDSRGTAVTTTEAVTGCGRITLESDYEATVVAQDTDAGVALLRPTEAIAPPGVAALASTAPRLRSEIAVAGYSYEGVLGAPTMTFGTLADLRGLNGEQGVKRLALAPFPGDSGGPVFDAGGSVVGMLLPPPSGGARQFPDGVSLAADADTLRALLEQSGIRPAVADPRGPMTPEALLSHATGMTVLVSCWE